MQPSGAFDSLKQLSRTGKWKIIDRTSLSDVAHEAEPEMNALTNVVVTPLSDLNHDRADSKELNTNEALVIRKLKGKAVEMDAAVVGNFDDRRNVDKENIDVECVDADKLCEMKELYSEKELLSSRVSDDDRNDVDSEPGE